jgi:hypothetical protein
MLARTPNAPFAGRSMSRRRRRRGRVRACAASRARCRPSASREAPVARRCGRGSRASAATGRRDPHGCSGRVLGALVRACWMMRKVARSAPGSSGRGEPVVVSVTCVPADRKEPSRSSSRSVEGGGAVRFPLPRSPTPSGAGDRQSHAGRRGPCGAGPRTRPRRSAAMTAQHPTRHRLPPSRTIVNEASRGISAVCTTFRCYPGPR